MARKRDGEKQERNAVWTRNTATVCALGAAAALACISWQVAAKRRVSLDSRTPPKMLPIDGDFPGGSTGIPADGYWTMDTSHGATPFFAGPGTDFMDAGVNPVVVTSPNVLDFGYNPAGAVRPRFAPLRTSALAARRPARLNSNAVAATGAGRGMVVASRPDAACLRCLTVTEDEWQRFHACSEVCVNADCASKCEHRNAVDNYGSAAPASVSKLCLRQCEVRASRPSGIEQN